MRNDPLPIRRGNNRVLMMGHNMYFKRVIRKIITILLSHLPLIIWSAGVSFKYLGLLRYMGLPTFHSFREKYCDLHLCLHARCYSSSRIRSTFNPLYTGGLFLCHMLDKSICHFRGVRSTLSLYSIFDKKSC